MLERGLEVDDGGRRSEVGRRGRVERFLAFERVQRVVALVVADERDPVCLSLVQHDGRPVAAHGVRVLAQLAVFEIERPDVVDVPVLRDVRFERHIRIRRGRREDDRVIVDELRVGFVHRAERDLRLLLRVEIEPEELLVSADAGVVDDVFAVGRVRGREVGEAVVGEVGDFLRREADGVDVTHRLAERRERDRLAVRRKRRRLGFVDRRHRNPIFNFLREHVLDEQRPLLFCSHEVGQPIALGRPRHPRHLRPLAVLDDVIEPHVLVETPGEVPDDRSVFARDQNDVDLAVLAVERHHGQQVAGRRRGDRDGFDVLRLLFVGRQVAPVVGGALLVAERLEALLQVALEGLVELVLLHLERFFVRVFTAADHALAQREDELPDAFLAELRLDELEHRVAEVVGHETGVPGIAVRFGLGHLRHDVRNRRVANHHQIERRPLGALVLRQPLVHPQRDISTD